MAQLPGLSSQLVQEETGWEGWDQIKVNLTKLWIPSVTRKLGSLSSFLNGIITEWDVCGWINLLFNSSQAVLRQLWLSNSTCLISFYLLSLLSPFLFSPQCFTETKLASYLSMRFTLNQPPPSSCPYLLIAVVLLASSATLILILNSHLQYFIEIFNLKSISSLRIGYLLLFPNFLIVWV